MKQIVGEPGQLAVDITAERKHRFVRIVKPHPGEIADVLRQRGLVEGEIARP
jgi:hypothetical protein